MAALGGVGMLQPLHGSRRPFAAGRALQGSKPSALCNRSTPSRQVVRAAFWKPKAVEIEEEEEEEEEKEDEAPAAAFDLRSLFGGAAKKAETAAEEVAKPVAASKRSSPPARATGRGTAKIGGAAKQRLGGTQRLGGRKPARIGTRIGTTRIGGRPGGTTVIGVRGKDAGPRGLFGGKSGRKDTGLVFVAGGTGRLGARIVRQLLLQGLKVRAGVRDEEKAQGYLDTAVAYGLLPKGAERRVQLVEYDITDPETLPAAIGNAAKVVSAIGAAEALDFGAPKKVDGEGGINLVNAARAAGVDHFVMVTSLGTGKLGWPAGILNLFGGVLIFKKKAEEALENSGLRYTIVRPGGMERPGDDYKETHNVTIAPRDTLFGGQVSRLQVADVVGTAIARSDLAENKVLELVAETTAPRREIELLLADAPQEADQDARAATAAAIADAESALGAVREEQQALAEQAADVQQQLAEAEEAEEEAPNQRVAARAAKAAQNAQQKLEALEEAAEQAKREEAAAAAVLRAAQVAQKQRSALSQPEIEQIQMDILYPPTEEELQERREAAQREREEAAAALRAEQERQADEARQAREAAVAEQRRAAEQKAAKAKAEADAREKAQAEAAAKREAETKARADEKSKADAEAKEKREAEAKAQAEAKAKAEKEAEEKKQAEVKAKAEKEAEEQKLAQAKARADAEAKAEADAEAKAKADSEARAKADAGAKANAEAKAKVDADAKAKADADAKARASAADPAAAAAAEEAKRNAGEAREWITNWRRGGGGGGAAAQPAAEEAEEDVEEEEEQQQGGGIFAGFKWPWQQETMYIDEEDAEETAEEPQQQPQQAAAESAPKAGSARAWINQWRAKQLEAKLPTDEVNAN